jgi:hypothetical protein
MRNLIVLCIVLSLISPVFADDWVITSFEGPDFDGIIANTPAATITPGSTRDVTDGSYSLRVQGPGSTWWSENFMLDLGAFEGGIDAFFSHETMSIDVSVYQDEWAMDTAVGWVSAPTIGLLLNPGSGQWWTLGQVPIGDPLTGDKHIRATWNYKAYRDQITVPQDTIKLIFNFTNNGYLSPASYYVDYAVLHTPEPTTMALLGLGGLVLLRRKK